MNDGSPVRRLLNRYTWQIRRQFNCKIRCSDCFITAIMGDAKGDNGARACYNFGRVESHMAECCVKMQREKDEGEKNGDIVQAHDG